MVIDKLIENIEAIDFNEIIEVSVDQTAKQFIETQQDQLQHGINSRGEKIGKYRNPAYARIKNAMNQLPGLGVPDLKLKGDYYREMFIDARANFVVIDSADSKAGELFKKYDALGLAKEFVPQYLKSFSPVATENIINQIHK